MFTKIIYQIMKVAVSKEKVNADLMFFAGYINEDFMDK